MPILKDIKSTVKLSGCDVEKVRRPRKRSSARTALSSSATLVTSHHNWPDFASEVSSGSSDHSVGSANWGSFAQTSSNQDFRLACPYAKLNSMVGIQSIGDSGDKGRPRCWSKSYPNIPRLKQHLHRVHCRMTTAQEKQIKRKTRGISPEVNWFAIWQILFTGQDPPASPYFEDRVSLNLWDNALANDRERLSAKIRDCLHGALYLTQLQQAILDHTVQQAVSEYSRDLHSRLTQNQTPSSGSDLNGASARFVDKERPSIAGGIPHDGEGHVWSPSMMQSYLPRSTLIPGTTNPPFSMATDLSLGLPPTMQPDANYLEQQRLGNCGDLFFGLSVNSNMFTFDNTEHYQWPAHGHASTHINMERTAFDPVSAQFA